MDQIREIKYNENERVYEILLSLRKPSFKKQYERFRIIIEQHLSAFNYGFRIGLLSGMMIGASYGLILTIRTKNPYYIPICAFVYAGVLSFANSIFYLIRS